VFWGSMMAKRLHRKRDIRVVGRLTDRATSADVAAGDASRQGIWLASTPVEATVNVASQRDSLVAVLEGGAKDKPEKMLRLASKHIKGLRMFGHARFAGQTFVSIICPRGSLDALRALSFVLRLQMAAPRVSSAPGAGELKPVARADSRVVASRASGSDARII